ncbi:MAG: PAS domain S-box protein [Sphingobacteriaceae bacterium]
MLKNNNLLHAIIENAIDGIITINPRGTIESINPSACELFGYAAQEVIGKNISALMPQPDRDQHNGYLERYQQTHKPTIIGIGREVKGLRKDGSVFPFRLAVSEVKFGEESIYTGFIHDLSREKAAEERIREYASQLENLVENRTASLQETVSALEEAKAEVSLSLEKEKELNQLKSRFVSMASHEFRTPLGAIQLSASLINKYAAISDETQIDKHVHKIKNSVENLTTILNDFLSLERLDAGKVELNFQEFDLVELAEEIIEEMQLISKPKQNIIYEHTGLKSSVYLDPNLLKNCIVNLIGNAIKYSGDDTFIQFNTEISDKSCTITISDDGIGIPETDQKHLFQPFFRAHNTGNIPGTGLGLNIVARYTAMMHGTIEYDSTINKGTSFTITF